MSSTNFRSILIFASCVVGTRNILPGIWVSFHWEVSYFCPSLWLKPALWTHYGALGSGRMVPGPTAHASGEEKNAR